MELAVSQEVPAAGEQSALRLPAYVLITPARNEAQFIELTLRSMVAQTALPLRWVIVSDGSTDETDGIVRRYAADHPWIVLLRMPERPLTLMAVHAHLRASLPASPRQVGRDAGRDAVVGNQHRLLPAPDA